MTTRRMPKRSAIRPIGMPPTAAPNQASEQARAGTERASPNSAAIGFSATTVITGAPNDTVYTASAVHATSHDARVSIEAGRVGPALTTEAAMADPAVAETA